MRRSPHPIAVVPPVPLASPADGALGPDVPFWRPGWRDVAANLGWRWVLFLPAAAAIGLLGAIPWLPRFAWWPLLGQAKLLLMAGGVAVAAAGSAVRSAVGRMAGPFCIHCGYGLTGLPDGHACPECGRPFRLAVIAEYRRDPAGFVERVRQGRRVPEVTGIAAGPVRSKRSRGRDVKQVRRACHSPACASRFSG